MTIHDLYQTLHPSSDDRALQQGFEARIHDPAWFLARQWQMGEHQGENASTPVRMTFRLRQAEIGPSTAAPEKKPSVVPAEAIVEAEPDDWWTMGRRIRVGKLLKDKGKLPQPSAGYLFRSPPPPYDLFHDQPDGLALWRDRGLLQLTAADFLPESPPDPLPFAWDSSDLSYTREFPAGGARLVVDRHRGGVVDWFSVDAQGPAVEFEIEPERTVLPVPLEYPGAPASRFWQIEDANVDLGGYPPDMAHFPTMLLIDLIYAHSDDWFLIPISTRAGQVFALGEVVVWDSFGKVYSEELFPQGLKAPDDWSLFSCRGLTAGQLVAWSVAETPLESGLIEQVCFGVDEAANLLWAVERILDGRDANSALPPAPPLAGQISGDLTQPRQWRYEPGDPPQPFWHPYVKDDDEHVFVQHGLADLTRTPPQPMPRPQAEVLQRRDAEEPTIHRLSSAAIPSNGIVLERRWSLARDLHGNPVLWIQRERKPLLAPPARRLRFDIAVSVGA